MSNRADVSGGGLFDVGCDAVNTARFLFDAERCEKSQDAIFNPDERWVARPALIGLLLEEFSALGGTIASIGLGASRSQATVNQ